MNIPGEQQIPKDKNNEQDDFDDMNEEEFEFTNSGGENKADDEFDQVVGALQEIVLDPEFEQHQRDFLGKYCMAFDKEEENKLEYMTIFKDYQDKIEKYIEQKLKETLPNSNMKDFLSQLQSRIEEIDPQLLEMLETFTDFQLFKEHMLAHKDTQPAMDKFEESKGEETKNVELTVAGHAIELEDPEKMIEEFEFTNSGGENKADDEFDQVVGALQEIVLDPEFEQQQNDFLGKHCMTFDNEEENKLEYTSIFKEYQDKIENYIEQKLKETMPNSNMKDFLSQLQSRIDEIDPQLLDMLETFTDFQLFKEHMLAHKKLQMSLEKKSKKFEQYTQETGGMVGIEQDLGGLTIAGHAKAIHSGNEQNLKEVQGTKDVLGAKENVTKPQEANMEKKPKIEDAGQPPKKVGKAHADYVPQQKENIFS